MVYNKHIAAPKKRMQHNTDYVASAYRWEILYSMFHDCPHLLLRIVQIGVFVDRFG